jgi:glycolate oxidase
MIAAMSRFASVDATLLARLADLVGGDHVLAAPEALAPYATDATEELTFTPEAVVRPGSAEEVAAVLAAASAANVPVTPRGGGSGLSGGALAALGGLVLSVERLDRIRAIDPADMVAEAETGVRTTALHEAVEAQGLLYPPDPSSRDMSFLGGNLAEDAAGPRSLLYGTTRQHVLALEVALADGSLFWTGGRNRKDVAGYNLTQLLIGSEGTLGVLTAAVLKLSPLPRASLSLLLPFRTLEEAAAAVETLCGRSRAVAACELVERHGIHAVHGVMPVTPWLLEQEVVLLLELHGDEPERLLEVAVELGELAETLGAGEVQVAQEAGDQRRLWAIRRKIGDAVMHRGAYRESDAVVPRSRLADLVRAARRSASRQGLTAVCFGHAGDGNLHILLLRDGLAQEPWERARDAAEEELIDAVLALGGSVTGEHGIGLTLREALPRAIAPARLALLRALKTAFDPRGILNPGKIFLD